MLAVITSMKTCVLLLLQSLILLLAFLWQIDCARDVHIHFNGPGYGKAESEILKDLVGGGFKGIKIHGRNDEKHVFGGSAKRAEGEIIESKNSESEVKGVDKSVFDSEIPAVSERSYLELF